VVLLQESRQLSRRIDTPRRRVALRPSRAWTQRRLHGASRANLPRVEPHVDRVGLDRDLLVLDPRASARIPTAKIQRARGWAIEDLVGACFEGRVAERHASEEPGLAHRVVGKRQPKLAGANSPPALA